MSGEQWIIAGGEAITMGVGSTGPHKSLADLIAADNRDNAGVAEGAELTEVALRVGADGKWYVSVQGALAPVDEWTPEAVAKAALAAAKRAKEVWAASDAVARIEAEERRGRMGYSYGITFSVGPTGPTVHLCLRCGMSQGAHQLPAANRKANGVCGSFQ